MRKSYFLLFLGCFFILGVSAQYVGVYEVNEGNCNFFIKDKNWPEGEKCFSQLLEEEPENQDYQYQIAKCYTYSNINKAKALEILGKLKASNYQADDFKLVQAMAYFYNYKFKEASAMFSELIQKEPEKKGEYERMVKQAERSKQMVSKPVWVSFENLGEDINSEAPDFLPMVSPDESKIYFTTKREGVVGNIGSSDGYKTADIYYAKHKRNNYSRPRSVGSPNTLGNEFTAGKSEDGTYLLYVANNDDYFYDIFISELGRRSYGAPKLVDSEDLKKSAEQGATITNDGTRIYFGSDREGGIGGYDIYYIQRLPVGGWSEPVNIGEPINTTGNEKFPSLMDNGTTLYFSSDGHPGMGDMDLFMSSLNSQDNNWGTPKNLGYPVNTPFDDFNISFAENKRYAYVAQRREDSFGDMDIYRLTFEDEKDDYSLVTGRIMNVDSINVEVDIDIEIFSEETEDLIGIYKYDSQKGKYSAILAPGKYRIEIIDVEGYSDYENSINILGKNDLQKLKKLDIILKQ